MDMIEPLHLEHMHKYLKVVGAVASSRKSDLLSSFQPFHSRFTVVVVSPVLFFCFSREGIGLSLMDRSVSLRDRSISLRDRSVPLSFHLRGDFGFYFISANLLLRWCFVIF